MHNLVIDIGNTNNKIAVFEGQNMVHFQRNKAFDFEELEHLVMQFKIENFTVSSVNAGLDKLVNFLQAKLRYFPFSTQVSAGIVNHYETLNTLGLDRWAKVIAAFKLFPKRNCLIIDAGTCITYDEVTSTGEYLGGSISLGIQMRFEALHHFTKKLPLVQWDRTASIPRGTNTQNALKSGVLRGILNEIEGFILAAQRENNALTILLTGGDSDFLMEQLKNSIFASQIVNDPYLVLKGLNESITA